MKEDIQSLQLEPIMEGNLIANLLKYFCDENGLDHNFSAPRTS